MNPLVQTKRFGLDTRTLVTELVTAEVASSGLEKARMLPVALMSVNDPGIVQSMVNPPGQPAAAHVVLSPWYVPPAEVHADEVRMEQAPRAWQHAPPGGQLAV